MPSSPRHTRPNRHGFTLIELPAVRKGFTLIELLVVVAIIVILLAILIPGLQKALQVAERSNCGTNQRSIAQASAQYALEYERTFPPATTLAGGTTYGNTAQVVRNAIGAAPTDATQRTTAVGVGHLIVQGRVGGLSQGGKAVHCPSLDTTSGLPLNTGMDQQASNDGAAAAVGASFFNLGSVVTSGYLYRGKSYAITHSGGTIRTNIAKQTFGITSDLVTYVGDAGNRSGRTFHHIEGWNVSFGDGHVSYIKDPEGPLKSAGAIATWKGKVERDVAQAQNIHGGVGAAAAADVNAIATERVFAWFGTGGGG